MFNLANLGESSQHGDNQGQISGKSQTLATFRWISGRRAVSAPELDLIVGGLSVGIEILLVGVAPAVFC
jgi:hypothetical protein